MSLQFDVLDAYHRAIGRHEEKTGEHFPLVRHTCVDEDERTITDTNVFNPSIVARWSIDGRGRIRIRLVGATR
jgi:hypothetical protein